MRGDYLQIEIDNSEMKKQIKSMGIIKEDTPIVFKKAVNSTVTSMKGFTATQISKNYYIDKQYVKSKIVARKVSDDLGGGYIYSKHRPMFVNRFKHTPNASIKRGSAPLFVNIKKSASGGAIQGAFIAPIKNGKGENTGKLGAFIRTDKRKKYKGSDSLTKKIHGSKRTYQQIEGVYGPGVTSMMNNKDVRDVVYIKVEKKFEKALDKSIDNILKKGGAK